MDTIWTTTEPVTAAAQASLRRMQAAIAVATGLAAAGRAIDLSGLDSVAGLLCAQVLDLHPDAGRTLGPALSELDTTIGSLMGSLKGTIQ